MILDMINALPCMSGGSTKWVVSKRAYARMLHISYLNSKAVRKAKLRKKRVNAKCGR